MKKYKYLDYNEPNLVRVQKIAEERNLEVLFPKDDELFIDIDNESDYELFKENVRVLPLVIEATYYEESPSPSGQPFHKHIRVRLDRTVTPLERILLQAVLGSDRKRELLGYSQLLKGEEHPTLFLENCV